LSFSKFVEEILSILTYPAAFPYLPHPFNGILKAG